MLAHGKAWVLRGCSSGWHCKPQSVCADMIGMLRNQVAQLKHQLHELQSVSQTVLAVIVFAADGSASECPTPMPAAGTCCTDGKHQ